MAVCIITFQVSCQTQGIFISVSIIINMFLVNIVNKMIRLGGEMIGVLLQTISFHFTGCGFDLEVQIFIFNQSHARGDMAFHEKRFQRGYEIGNNRHNMKYLLFYGYRCWDGPACIATETNLLPMDVVFKLTFFGQCRLQLEARVDLQSKRY